MAIETQKPAQGNAKPIFLEPLGLACDRLQVMFVMSREELKEFRFALLHLMKNNSKVKDAERLADYFTNFLVVQAKGSDNSFFYFKPVFEGEGSKKQIIALHLWWAKYAQVDETGTATPIVDSAGKEEGYRIREKGEVYSEGAVHQEIRSEGVFIKDELKLSFEELEKTPFDPLPSQIVAYTGIDVLTLAAHDFGGKGKPEGTRF